MTRRYSNPRISACEISYSVDESWNQCTSTEPSVASAKFSLSDANNISIQDRSGTFDNGVKYTESGATDVVVVLSNPVETTFRTAAGTLIKKPEHSFDVVFSNEGDGKRMLSLLQTYSKMCMESRSEEVARKAAEQREAEAEAAGKLRKLQNEEAARKAAEAEEAAKKQDARAEAERQAKARSEEQAARDREWEAKYWETKARREKLTDETQRRGYFADPGTGLTWAARTSEELTSGAAKGYCNALVLAGKKDWRLPTIEELETLFTATEFAGGVVVKPTHGPTEVWSSTPGPKELGYHTVYAFYLEIGRRNAERADNKNIITPALCVRRSGE